MHYIRSSGGLALALLLAGFVTCKSDDRATPLNDLSGVPGDGLGGSAGRGGSSSTDVPDAAVVEVRDAGDNEGLEGTVVNCGSVACRGAGRCLLMGGEPTCVCDKGYTLTEAGACIVDETCIELRVLERACRQRIALEPAIAMAFYVETCAGTTVQPGVLGDLSSAFEVLEDDNDLGDESYATVFHRPVESFVVIALDMSSSVAKNANLLANLIELTKGLVDDLMVGPLESPVRVQLMAFGRSVHLKLPFDEDPLVLKAVLDDMQDNPAQAVSEPDGTNLNGVVNQALEQLEFAIDARVEETGGAVLVAGSLITITDGRDTGGVRLETIPSRFNVISIGVSGNINDDELTRVGPQGSFLAPDQADREAVFETVAQRVNAYPDRAHLLAYCSPAVAGRHEVVATTANLPARVNATCEFNATAFGSGSACNEAFIQSYCGEPSHGCGTFLACAPPCSSPPPDAGPPRDAWDFSD